MDGSFVVSDPTDWLTSSLPSFSTLENALRCQVCKDFFNTPMITSCSHTFCSLCIRRCLSAEGKCPACRTSDQASKLRRDWALEEVVATFQAARPSALELATEHKQLKEEVQHAGTRSSKRRRVESNGTSTPPSSQRQTRSRAKNQSSAPPHEVMVIDDDEDDGDYKEAEASDGLVSCPMCGERMKEEAVFGHIDRCKGPAGQRRKQSQTPTIPLQRPSPRPQPQERLPELNYSILSDGALRKKLKEIGIPNAGPKQLMIRRHTEWVNLWNSNCDSARPKTKRELLHELDVWERSQGGMARESHGSVNGIMKKEFDAQAYATSNRDDFSRLIAEARKKAKRKDVVQDQTSSAQENDIEPSPGKQDGETGAEMSSQLPYEQSIDKDVRSEAVERAVTNGIHPEVQAEGKGTNGDLPAEQRRASEDLPQHFTDPSVRKVPMFTVPQDPVSDAEAEHEQR